MQTPPINSAASLLFSGFAWFGVGGVCMSGSELITTAVSTIEEVAVASAAFARHLSTFTVPAQALDELVSITVTAVPGAEYAGITRGSRGQFQTLAATDAVVHAVDAIQYELTSGPCVDAILEKSVFRTGDLREDPRWPQFGRRAAQETGILSMLAFRLYLEDDDAIAGLNLYARPVDAFDALSQTIGTLLASHAALAMGGVLAQQRVVNLERALASNREIGVAMGILMARHSVTREQAFDLLRLASQNTNRKLISIATEVADTGAFELTAAGARPRSAAPALRRPAS